MLVEKMVQLLESIDASNKTEDAQLKATKHAEVQPQSQCIDWSTKCMLANLWLRFCERFLSSWDDGILKLERKVS